MEEGDLSEKSISSRQRHPREREREGQEHDRQSAFRSVENLSAPSCACVRPVREILLVARRQAKKRREETSGAVLWCEGHPTSCFFLLSQGRHESDSRERSM